ncbi:hypothetical protein [Proteiniborus sp. MB09-C3]|uniref:RipA family octameric membrane protein n=1 Tax=Proteiniborus sp. MB09-C3 TaxID=3050072 RepID=UPI0025571381|nr:hypothetical protein [Proteiniborus sp. MB09-C3]WIV11113.1 hypothetical protein QO263_13270 [Proteiniborus sp. MB09-C3]
MKLFVIHRLKDNQNAKKRLNSIAQDLPFKLHLTFLDSCNDRRWKEKAEKAIYEAEAVIMYNPKFCKESDNVKWEIEKATNANKEILELYEDNETEKENVITRLLSIYNFEEEFNSNFSLKDNNDVIELYKMMVESSERLIERRQKTNAFFITVIGSLLAIATLLSETDILNGNSRIILYGFSGVGLLLCNSWRNLIDNYGKLNKAKFDVILKLEKKLSDQIYQAEWVALGKGLRPEKYKSFTSTEKNVPLYFGILIIVLTFIITLVELC